jgi:AraC-like DNA-binding protein
MDIAQQHLRYKSMAITNLALKLGCGDVSVFNRNIKQWIELSPRQWQIANA